MVSNEIIIDRVKDSVSQVLSINRDKINLESSLINDLGMDSFAGMELMFSLEEKFKLSIPDDIIRNKLIYVKDIVEYIQKSVPE